MDLLFDVPTGMTPEQLAHELMASLRQVRKDPAHLNCDSSKGPFRMRENSDESWQLDGTNDYWLHILEDGKANFRCRYRGEEWAIKEAMELFKARLAPQ